MRKIKARGGFTLLEIVISIGILAIISVFALQMFATSLNTEDKARDLDNAVAVASSVIESINAFKSLPPSDDDINALKTLMGEGIACNVRENGEINIEISFGPDWKPALKWHPDGYMLYASILQPSQLGVRDIKVAVTRQQPYRLSNERNITLYTLTGAKYSGLEVAP